MLEATGLRERWDGAGWRWWSLVAGGALVLVSAAFALLLAAILGERTSALLTVILIVELLVLCLSGSGLLMSTTRRMSRGGLQRETATIDVDHRPPDEREAERRRDQDLKDRHTIRTGLVALPVFVALVVMLAR